MKRMMWVVAAVAAGSILTGCASPAQIAARNELIQQRKGEALSRIQEIERARNDAVVTCSNKASCDKAFSLAKIYIQQNADMKIQSSDDTIISTFNGTEKGYVSMGATKVPDVGETAKINLTARCEGMEWVQFSVDDFTYNIFSNCSDRILRIYNGFKPYVEPKIK